MNIEFCTFHEIGLLPHETNDPTVASSTYNITKVDYICIYTYKKSSAPGQLHCEKVSGSSLLAAGFYFYGIWSQNWSTARHHG